MADEFDLSMDLPSLSAPSVTELKEASESAGLTFDPEAAAIRLAAAEATEKRLAEEAATAKPPISSAPSENSIFNFDFSQYQLDPTLVSTPFTPSPQPTPTQGYAQIKPSERLSENILPGLFEDAARVVAKNIAITIALAALGYYVAGWKGALGGALLWIGPNIPAALRAQKTVEKALSA